LLKQDSTKQTDIWTASRVDIQTIQAGGYRRMYTQIAATIPTDATIGLFVSSHFIDYPLFGEGFSRTVIPVFPLENLGRSEWLDKQGLDYILIQNPTDETLSLLPDGAKLIHRGDFWALFSWKNPTENSNKNSTGVGNIHADLRQQVIDTVKFFLVA
jgi:hypothetical protein